MRPAPYDGCGEGANRTTESTDWNVLSFEMTDKSNQIDFIVDEYVDLIKAQNPDIVCINELETGTSRMGKEKLTELASRLDMYPTSSCPIPRT